MFQFHHLLDYLNCRDNAALQLGLVGAGREERRRIGEDLLRYFGMERHAEKLPSQLSGGESQRIAVLRAIAHDPRVVLADEPTGNLDAANAARVLDALRIWQLRCESDDRARTLLLATHNFNDAFACCNYLLVLKHGIPYENRLLAREEFQSAEELGRLLLTADGDGPKPGGTKAAGPGAGPAVWKQSPPGDGRLRFGYLFHLGRCDLRRHCWSALTSGLMLVMLVVLAVVGVGLLEGKRRSMSRELESRLALRLDANCLSRGENAIDPPLLKKLTTEVVPPRRLLTRSPADLHPWSLADMLFWEVRNGEPTARVNHYVSGRTIPADDAILARLAGDDRDATLFSADTAWEIVVTEGFLKECNYPAEARVVWLDCKQTPVPLVVRRVAKSLPGEYRFILPDGLYREISADGFDPDPLVSSVWLEPLAAGESEVLSAIAATISKRSLDAHFAEGRLELRVRNNRLLPASRLRKYADEVRLALEERKVAKPGGVQLRLPPVPATQGRQTWTHVGIDSAGLDDLQPIAGLIQPYGLNVDPHYIDAMERLRRTVGPLAAVLIFVILVAGFVVTVNFVLTSWQRVAQSRYQLGILKAGGMLARHIALLLGGQAVILGAVAGGVGILVGRLVGQVVGDRVAEGWFCFSPGMTVAVFMVTVAVTGLGCLLGTVWTIRREPVDLLIR